MQLSIIIVNHNVKHFLEQCLYSVEAALKKVSGEILLIDNNSTDNSIGYLQPKFPDVQFIINKENEGFGKACNRGLQIAKGDYILFLNPDTIVPEDCFEKCILFFKANSDAGALGIKMIDGSGQFLKESKRSFPGPLTSSYKLFGLSKLFPRSKTFGRYHLGYLNQNESHEIDVIAGAFMMIKKEVLDKTGGFDESFFMYGEDVDLSYRIQKAGFKNYYFAESAIIHFKGESTKKGSMNYVQMFYNAMSIFVRKHYSGSKAGFFNAFIHLAIWFRAGLTAIASFIRRMGLPLIDASLILLSFWFTQRAWAAYVKTSTDYDQRLLNFALPAFTIFYLITAYYAGLYDNWYKRSHLIRTTATATIILLAAYSLLPENYRFSRGTVLFGGIIAFLLISLCRWVLTKMNVLKNADGIINTVVAGTKEEYDHMFSILQGAEMDERILGRIAVSESDNKGLDKIENLKDFTNTLPVNEIIFCQGQLSFADIIFQMQQLPKGISAKIHALKSNSIVGSHSKDSSGETLSKETGYKLANPYYKRLKRLIDVIFAVFALITFPIQMLIIKKPFTFLGNCLSVLSNTKTWIGYSSQTNKLPQIKKAILASNGMRPIGNISYTETLQTVDDWYARDYEPLNDVKLIIKHYRLLGS